MKIQADVTIQMVIWRDRCDRIVNLNDERDHFHDEQCGGCRKYKRIDSDWGLLQESRIGILRQADVRARQLLKMASR